MPYQKVMEPYLPEQDDNEDRRDSTTRFEDFVESLSNPPEDDDVDPVLA